ncbi:MMPL family transporter [Cohnella thailandensis]|uniref:MMPL family transporter n=1 Tax=Cohnella thailandensis TaxID=557557 RepID=A0A841SY31_9BACL|nr:MMPL family transporter [Cohnella thailandensis]MBB6636172.1 MMPL family transporter [Cohnella thailandensis]MBP1973859.1 RND superfamily putative drug exporter [Cohnella thailandensis]
MKENTFLGRWVAGKRSRWITLLVWIVAAALLNVLLPAVGDQERNNAPNLSDSKPSVQAEAVSEQQFPSGADVPALFVWHRGGGLTDADLQNIQKLSEKLTAEPVPHQTTVPPLHQMPLQALKSQLSEDGTAFVSPVLFEKAADTDQLKDSVDEIKEEVRALFGSDPFEAAADSGELSARVSGPVGIQIDATGLFQNADFALMVATVLLVLVLLLLIYRSPILAIIPIVAVGFAYLAVSPILGWMAREGWITVDSQGISIMTVLLFGAGTDYCLFLIARFRQLLKTESDRFAALRAAITDSSGAIAMSGITVVLALFALLLAEYGAYQRFAAPFSIAILIMGIASLTLVPALLAIVGRASFWPFVPRTREQQAERAARRGKPAPAPEKPARNRVGSLVVRKPWTIVIVCVVVLGALAGASTQVKFTYDILSSFPKDMESREGFATIGDKFTPGELAPAQVIVDSQGKDVSGLADRLESLDYISVVGEPQTGRSNPNIVMYEIQFAMNPYSLEAMGHIPDLRETAEDALAQAGVSNAEDSVWVGGQTAEQHDNKATGERDTRVIIPVVIGLITLLLLLYLRSAVATVYLVLTVILSYFSALGLGWLVLHHFMGADAIQGSIPLYAFVFLVALGEDYNIFMISSIWQKRRTMPLKQAIKEGVGETSSVITSAGLILAGTFAVLGTLPIQVLVQFGTVTAIGVLLDTFVVRPFLVPAITTLLGRAAFWPGRYEPVEESKSVAG